MVFSGVVSGALHKYPSEVMPAVPSSPTDVERERLSAYIRGELAKGPSAADSIRLLYNLFDLGPKSVSGPLIDTIYELALRTGNDDAEFEMLRQKANMYIDSAEIVADCLARVRAKKGTKNPLVRDAELYIRMQQILSGVGNDVQLTDPTVEGTLNGLIARYISNPPTDPYERVEAIFTICTYMGNLGEGRDMEHYVELMREALDALPLVSGDIRRAVYTRNAVIATNFGLYRQALAIDRKHLRMLDSMQVRFGKNGRLFRSSDAARYTIYRRMLANAAGLRSPEVERLWAEINDIASRNSDVAADMAEDHRAQIYYLMAVKEYAKVVPLILKRVRNKSRSLPYREILYNDLITAAEETGDEKVLLEAYREYTDMLRERLNNRQAESIRELSIAYSVNDMKEERDQVQHELAERERTRTLWITGLSVLAILMLVVMVLVLWTQKKRAAAAAETIERINGSLVAERDKLQAMKTELIAARDEAKRSDKVKTDFINNMSHEIRTPLNSISECSRLIVDCIPDDKSPFLDKFGRIIEQNVKLMERLVNDVLDLASLDNNELSIDPMAVPVIDICNFVMTMTSESMQPGVALEFEPSEEVSHLVVVTDRQRVIQVLMNLLNNAAKFTEKGRVRLDVDVDKTTNTLKFAVSDTGIGIRKGNEEVIFERFRQLDMNVNGCGLGLYIARMVARLLGGDVKVDTSYRGGARFVFTLPLNA